MDKEESYWELFWLNLKVKYRNFREYCRVVRRFYNNPQFRCVDLRLLKSYFWKNPFTVSREFLSSKGYDDRYVYGETPLTSLEMIAKASQIQSSDTVFDLGCGRGRGCFWLNSFCGCKVVGIDFIPAFIQKAVMVKHLCGVEGVNFKCENFLESNFTGATVFYLNGTCLDKNSIQKLIKKLIKLPKGTKIITVSYPLQDFTDLNQFQMIKALAVPFTWGEGVVYIQRLI